MAQSLARIVVHVIFSTKARTRCLVPAVRGELYAFSGTVLKSIDCPPIQIGGTDDHVHVLCALSKNLSAAKLVEEVKKPTSRWLKTKGAAFSGFHWQNGYGVFSVSQSAVARTAAYILGQEEHHREVTFQEEYRRFLKKYGVEYDERYVWD